ncbi:hypothetical protein LIER_10096 [Lithospermum erythrorhizon]|uniref:Uncharacterized protein n=1 Tax=Lithospermum erythrorhizon TaxID=34254 RepID=A0AAV3PK35_LITER
MMHARRCENERALQLLVKELGEENEKLKEAVVAASKEKKEATAQAMAKICKPDALYAWFTRHTRTQIPPWWQIMRTSSRDTQEWFAPLSFDAPLTFEAEGEEEKAGLTDANPPTS